MGCLHTVDKRQLKDPMSFSHYHYLTTWELLPVTDVASEHLGEAVAPEEAAQHHAGLPLAPAELLCHADGTDGHRHAGAVEEARPQ